MASRIKIIIIIFFAVILQVSFFSGLTGGKIIPDVALILIILWSGRKKFEDVWFWAIFSGIILDIVMFEKIGINAIAFLLVSFVVSFLEKRFFITQREGSFLITLIFVVGATVANLIVVDILADFYINISLSWVGVKIVGNLIVAVFLQLAMLRFGKVFGIRESKLLAR